MRLICYVLVAALLGLPAAAFARDRAASGAELAWFQPHTIFYSGLRDTHTIALTFDDGPNIYTPAVLDALRAGNVKATFFIVGKMAKAHPEILAQIAADGHLLANHSATHPELTSKFDDDPKLLIDQLRIVNDYIAPLMKPSDVFFFRAPYGYWRKTHAAILNADPILRNYVGPIYWDIGGDISMRDGYVMSSADWDCWRHKWTPQVCAKGYLREIRRDNGGVLLMHCIHRQSGELVAAIVPAMLQEGYKFVRLDQVPAYHKFETPQAAPLVAGLAPLSGDSQLASSSVK